MKYERREALRLTAAMLSRSYGVKVVFRDIETAATDSSIIYLPNLAATGTEEDMKLLYGLLTHEAAHCRLTNFKIGSDVPFINTLVNLFEDIRIELKMARIYPGAKKFLLDAATGVVERDIITFPSFGVDTANVLVVALVTKLREECLGQACFADLAISWCELAQERMGNVFQEVLSLARRSSSLVSTAEALKLAQDVYELLKSSFTDDSNQDSSGGQSSDSSQDGSGGQSSDGNQDSSGGQSSDGGQDGSAGQSSDGSQDS